MNFTDLRARLQWLNGEDGVAPKPDVLDVLGGMLQPLLDAEGLDLLVPKDTQRDPLDFAARSQVDRQGKLSVAIEYTHLRQPISRNHVYKWLKTISGGPFNRALVIARGGFSYAACDVAAKAVISVELLDLAAVGSWIDRLERANDASTRRFELLIRALSHDFAEMVAENPAALDHLEWRDLERMIHRVMEGLGFEATLTPPSKDGGKDLILKCTVRNHEQTFIVELKHWRAGKRVGQASISDFLKVVVAEQRDGGLFLSTSGYTADVYAGLTQVTRQRIQIGGRPKVVSLVRNYIRANSGLWTPPEELPRVLSDETQDQGGL